MELSGRPAQDETVPIRRGVRGITKLLIGMVLDNAADRLMRNPATGEPWNLWPDLGDGPKPDHEPNEVSLDPQRVIPESLKGVTVKKTDEKGSLTAEF
ncbi:MAG TPA: hypothetical protein VGA08_02685 [Candidatus Saccharimonadales bacterium]